MTEREYNLMRAAILARGIVLVAIGFLIGGMVWFLTISLKGADTNDSLTTILGGLAVGLTTAFGIVANAFARDLSEFITNARAAKFQPDDRPE